MAKEKYRHENPDRPKMHTYARVMLVLSVVQILFSTSLHIMGMVDQMLLIMVGIVALVCGVLAAFMWPGSRAFRNVVRGVLVGAPLIVMAFGAFSAIYATIYNPDSAPLYNWELYGSLATQFTQLVLVFLMPALVAAASYGARTDRVFLNVAAVLHAAAVAFISYYMAGDMGMIDFTMDHAAVKAIYVAYAVVFAGMTFVPALFNDPDHTIRKA